LSKALVHIEVRSPRFSRRRGWNREQNIHLRDDRKILFLPIPFAIASIKGRCQFQNLWHAAVDAAERRLARMLPVEDLFDWTQ